MHLNRNHLRIAKIVLRFLIAYRGMLELSIITFCINRPRTLQNLTLLMFLINLKRYEKQCCYGGHYSTVIESITAVKENCRR